MIVVTLSGLSLSIEGHAVGGKGANWMRACAAVSAVVVMLEPRASRPARSGSAAFALRRRAARSRELDDLGELDDRALATLRLIALRYPKHVKVAT